jgi:TrmH family RNA methyltransferase
MSIELGPRSPLVKRWKDLKKSSVRAEWSLFLAEGTNAAREALRTKWPVEALCCTRRWLERHPEMASSFTFPPVLLTEPALKLLTDADTPDGVVLVCRDQGQKGVPAHSAKAPFLGVLATELQDPGNLGTLVRSSVATGAQPVVLGPGSVDPRHPKALRATAGLWFQSPAWRLASQPELINWIGQLKERGVFIAAAAAAPSQAGSGGLQADQSRPHSSFWHCDFSRPTCFLVGNEARGIDPALTQLADTTVSIPMDHRAESLNVGVAGSLLLYEALRQRQLTPSGGEAEP